MHVFAGPTLHAFFTETGVHIAGLHWRSTAVQPWM